jgi:hypothetical protein
MLRPPPQLQQAQRLNKPEATRDSIFLGEEKWRALLRLTDEGAPFDPVPEQIGAWILTSDLRGF